MPAKDKYHDNVINALKKDGWRIVDDPYMLLLDKRRLYVDLLIRRGDIGAVLIEVKVFDGISSPINYLSNAIGQYLLYNAALDLLEDNTPIYLAIPEITYDTLLTEELASHFIQYTKTKLVIYNPTSEVIVKWIT